MSGAQVYYLELERLRRKYDKLEKAYHTASGPSKTGALWLDLMITKHNLEKLKKKLLITKNSEDEYA